MGARVAWGIPMSVVDAWTKGVCGGIFFQFTHKPTQNFILHITKSLYNTRMTNIMIRDQFTRYGVVVW